MSVFIGVVGAESPPRKCTASIQVMQRPRDSIIYDVYNTLGHVARQRVVNRYFNEFIDTHEYLLFLDSDMVFAPDTIPLLMETARTGKTVVAGVAYRRVIDEPLPALFEDDPAYRWPMMPLLDLPSETAPFKVGAAGFACTLVHRDALRAMQALIRDEWIVAISDMCYWPHDPLKVDELIQLLVDDPQGSIDGDVPRQLRQELRVLRGENSLIGGDLRFSYYMRRAGHDVWVDPRVQPGHVALYPIGKEYYEWRGGAEAVNSLIQGVYDSRRGIASNQEALTVENEVRDQIQFHEREVQKIERVLHEYNEWEAAVMREVRSKIEQEGKKRNIQKFRDQYLAHQGALKLGRRLLHNDGDQNGRITVSADTLVEISEAVAEADEPEYDDPEYSESQNHDAQDDAITV